MRAPGALQYDDIRFQAPHASFVDQLVPVCAALLDAATQVGEVTVDVDAYTLLRGIGHGALTRPEAAATPHHQMRPCRRPGTCSWSTCCVGDSRSRDIGSWGLLTC